MSIIIIDAFNEENNGIIREGNTTGIVELGESNKDGEIADDLTKTVVSTKQAHIGNIILRNKQGDLKTIMVTVSYASDEGTVITIDKKAEVILNTFDIVKSAGNINIKGNFFIDYNDFGLNTDSACSFKLGVMGKSGGVVNNSEIVLFSGSGTSTTLTTFSVNTQLDEIIPLSIVLVRKPSNYVTTFGYACPFFSMYFHDINYNSRRVNGKCKIFVSDDRKAIKNDNDVTLNYRFYCTFIFQNSSREIKIEHVVNREIIPPSTEEGVDYHFGCDINNISDDSSQTMFLDDRFALDYEDMVLKDVIIERQTINNEENNVYQIYTMIG